MYRKKPRMTKLVWKAEECVTAWFNKCHRFQLESEIQIFPQGSSSLSFALTEEIPILSNCDDLLLKWKSLSWSNWPLSCQLRIFLSFELESQLFTFWRQIWKWTIIHLNFSPQMYIYKCSTPFLIWMLIYDPFPIWATKLCLFPAKEFKRYDIDSPS